MRRLRAARLCSPRGEWTRIADAGHNIQEDNPRELLDALKRLLIRVDSANPVNKLLPL